MTFVRPIHTPLLIVLGMASALAAGRLPWHLDRLDQRTRPLDGRFTPRGDGTGVHAYVIDTGVRRTHREFEGRADWIGDFVTGTSDSTGWSGRR